MIINGIKNTPFTIEKMAFITMVMFATSVIFASSQLGDKRLSKSDRYKNTNICTPAKMIVKELEAEIASMSNGNSDLKLSELRAIVLDRKQQIDISRERLSEAKSDLVRQESRLDILLNHMGETVGDLNSQILEHDRNIDYREESTTEYIRLKAECRGGIIGSFCRKKYKKKIKKSQDSIEISRDRIASLSLTMNELPLERDSLPENILKTEKLISTTSKSINELTNARPTIFELESRISMLAARSADRTRELSSLTDQLDKSVYVFKKCRHMRVLAKAHPLMQKHVENFKKSPALCNSIDSLVQNSEKEHEQIALRDAHSMICNIKGININNANDLVDASSDEDNQSQTIEVKLEDIIETPMGDNGEYKNFISSAPGKPLQIGTLGGDSAIKQIRFHVSYDIEEAKHSKVFDYLLLKDVSGKVIKKITGSGEEDFTVNSSRVDVFFYSDGRGAGRGAFIVDVETTVEQ